jgi:hypothetical protein
MNWTISRDRLVPRTGNTFDRRRALLPTPTPFAGDWLVEGTPRTLPIAYSGRFVQNSMRKFWNKCNGTMQVQV